MNAFPCFGESVLVFATSPWIQRCAGRIGRQLFLKLGLPATENEVKVDPLVGLLFEETYLLCRQRRRNCVDETG